MTTIKMSGGTLGGVIQGSYGTYQADSAGLFDVDVRDAPTMLTLGALYVRKQTVNYNVPIAPAAASATAFIASTTLSDGDITFANQPDVVRPASLVLGQIASPGPSAGSISIIYDANDGSLTTDSFSLSDASIADATLATSKGVAHFVTGSVSGLTGSGYFTLGSDASLSLPVPESAVDISVVKETIDSGDEAVGTLSSTILATIAPTTAPNGTHTFSFLFDCIAPIG